MPCLQPGVEVSVPAGHGQLGLRNSSFIPMAETGFAASAEPLGGACTCGNKINVLAGFC